MPRGGRSTLAELVAVALILGSVAAVIDAPGADHLEGERGDLFS